MAKTWNLTPVVLADKKEFNRVFSIYPPKTSLCKHVLTLIARWNIETFVMQLRRNYGMLPNRRNQYRRLVSLTVEHGMDPGATYR